MSNLTVQQEINLNNYNILNTIIPKYYKKKFPYDIIKRGVEPSLKLTHKNVDLIYIKDKKYFVEANNFAKYKNGGIYGGASGKIQIYFI
jgi:hypothetical protein